MDAETGEQEVFDRASGAPPACAVAASTAFAGTYPPITIDGRRCMNGTLRSATNAGLAAGARTLVVTDPRADLLPGELLPQELARSPRRTRSAAAKASRPVAVITIYRLSTAPWSLVPGRGAGFGVDYRSGFES
ncbi:hypothetical protein [Streptomyces sp. NPDC046759]|uniref:hypothetical protein n=1 Tax=Streptomyces sp. NPDC046759 TaxID=3155019 RepID=UPI0033DD3DEB